MTASEIVARAAAEIRAHMANGDKKSAKAVVESLRGRVPFPRIDEVLEEYDDPDYKKDLWGMWGPGDDLVMSGTASVEEAFCDNAGMLMSSKGMSEGRTLAAIEAGVQGAQRIESGEENMCDLCASLDGMLVPYPSEEFDALDAPAHCSCEFLWMYVDAEESNFQPDTTMDDIDNLLPLIEKHGHDLPRFATSTMKTEYEALVSTNALQEIWDKMQTQWEAEINSEGEII